MVQSGDITCNDGSGGESIYGESFEDERLDLQHNQEGLVGMSNRGPNTNQSQFYVTTELCSQLDETYVIVGKVVKGLNIFKEMSNVPRENDKPLEKIVIYNCGEFKPGESWNINESDGTLDVYPAWPNDWSEGKIDNFKMVEKAVMAIKNSGNHFYNMKNFMDSERKYVKTLRYIDWYLCHRKDKGMENLRILSMLNLAAVKLKRGKSKEVVELCSQILDKDPKCVKALYRRANAKLALKDYDKALEDLQKAISYHPNDKTLHDLLKMAKHKKLRYLRKEKLVFSKMFK